MQETGERKTSKAEEECSNSRSEINRACYLRPARARSMRRNGERGGGRIDVHKVRGW